MWLNEITTLIALFLCSCKGSEVASSFKLMETTIHDIQAAVKAGALTYERLTSLYLQRIVKYDRKVNAVLQINANAREEAAALDVEYREFGIRGPVHGIPVLLKDMINQKGSPTTAGSIAMKNCIPNVDSTTVNRLKAAGAVILGKVSLSEFAVSFNRPGFSSLGGTVLNPYRSEVSASGSSSGSGAAIAANFAVISIGSDTAGSIRGPASATSLVGIKPSKGLISLDGVVPLAPFVDVIGPLARTVTDAAIFLGILTGVDERDARTFASGGNFLVDYTPSLKRGSLKGKRLGIVSSFGGDNREIDTIFEEGISDLKKLGAEMITVDFTKHIEDPEILAAILSGTGVISPLIEYECKESLDKYFFGSADDCPNDVMDLVNIIETYANAHNLIDQARLESFRVCISNNGTGDPEYTRITKKLIPEVEERISEVMTNLRLDAFVYPTMTCSPRPTWYIEDLAWKCDSDDQWRPLYVANVIGWPDITVPMGVTESTVPVGMSFLAPKWAEATLISFAYDYEQETMHRIQPSGFEALNGEEFAYSGERRVNLGPQKQ